MDIDKKIAELEELKKLKQEEKGTLKWNLVNSDPDVRRVRKQLSYEYDRRSESAVKLIDRGLLKEAAIILQEETNFLFNTMAADLLVANGNYHEARILIEPHHIRDSEGHYFLGEVVDFVNRGRLYAKMGDYEKALEQYERRFSNDFDEERLEIYKRMGDLEKALKLSEKIKDHKSAGELAEELGLKEKAETYKQMWKLEQTLHE